MTRNDDTQIHHHSEDSLKGDEKSAIEPGMEFPEGGWAAWATVIGACVHTANFSATIDLTV